MLTDKLNNEYKVGQMVITKYGKIYKVIEDKHFGLAIVDAQGIIEKINETNAKQFWIHSQPKDEKRGSVRKQVRK